MKNKVILYRRGITSTLQGGNDTTNVTYDRGTARCRARVQVHSTADDKIFPLDTPENEVFDFIDEVLGEKVDRENVMAYYIKSPLSSGYGEYPNDLYDAYAIFSDYTRTFRTPVENYCIAVLNDDNSLDFSGGDAMIRDAVIDRLAEAHYRGGADFMSTMQNRSQGKHAGIDHVNTAWLLSEYLKGVESIKPKRMTVKEFQSVYVSYPHGCPVYSQLPIKEEIA